MKKLIIISLLFTLIAIPSLMLAQDGIADITEECCKIGAKVTWTSGKINGHACPNATYCVIEKNMTVGPPADNPPTKGIACSLLGNGASPAEGDAVQKWTDDWPVICAVGTIYTVTNWIFFLMMALAVILSVIGGATYMLAAGDADKASKGKSIITFAIIGLAIALVARFIPPIVKFIMGVS